MSFTATEPPSALPSPSPAPRSNSTPTRGIEAVNLQQIRSPGCTTSPILNNPPNPTDHVPDDPTPEPPSNLAKSLILTAASSILFIDVGYTNTYGVFQDHYQTVLFPTTPKSSLILIGSVSASLYLILGLITGPFADVFGYRTSLLLGSALMVGSMFAASASTTYWQLFLSQGLGFGLGLAFVYSPTTAISRMYFGPQSHGLANGIVVSGGALGGCVLPYAVRRMIESYGLPGTFRTLGFLALGILLPSSLALRPRPSLGSARRPGRPILDLTLLQNPKFLGLALACAIAMTGFLPRYFLIPSSAMFVGIGPTYASWLLGIMNGLSIIGRVGIGYFADRHGKVNALSASFLLCGLGHVAFWLPGLATAGEGTDAPTVLLTLFVIYIGILGSGFISLFPVVVAHLFGKERLASRTGLLNTAVGFTTLAGPSAVYAIVDENMGAKWTAGVLASGIFMIVGGVILAGGSTAMIRFERGR